MLSPDAEEFSGLNAHSVQSTSVYYTKFYTPSLLDLSLINIGINTVSQKTTRL